MVKELEAILLTWIKSRSKNETNETKRDGVDGDADVLDWQGAWLGASTILNENVLTRTRTNREKKAV